MKRRKHSLQGLLGIGLLLGLLHVGCASNFVVRHKSFQVTQPIRVYIDKKLLCVVKPQKECSKQLKKGRHVFYAEAKGKRVHRWGKKSHPTPFAVDKKTIIDLHDPSKHKPTSAD